MTVPQPFQYQGSQRALAPLILQYLPISTTRLVEPFCGSAALSIATAARGRTAKMKAAEQRPIVAHGVSRGSAIVINQKPRQGATEPLRPISTAPSGASFPFTRKPTADAVGYYLPPLRGLKKGAVS